MPTGYFDDDSLLDFYSDPSRRKRPRSSRMPVYLLHGFRWPRPLIRIHIILQNLEDAAAEWLVAPDTTEVLLENLTESYPETMEHLPNLRFIEQYDPDDVSPNAGSQPYAYVADVVHDIKLGLDVDEIRGKGVSNEQWGALLELRDKLAPEEKVGWFVVVCGDEERLAPPPDEEIEETEDTQASYTMAPMGVSMGPPLVPMPQANGHSYHQRQQSQQQQIYEAPYRPRTAGSTYTSSSGTGRRDPASPDLSRTSRDTASQRGLSSPETPQRGFKKLLGSLSRRKSRASIKDMPISPPLSAGFTPPVPPLPRQKA